MVCGAVCVLCGAGGMCGVCLHALLPSELAAMTREGKKHGFSTLLEAGAAEDENVRMGDVLCVCLEENANG